MASGRHKQAFSFSRLGAAHNSSDSDRDSDSTVTDDEEFAAKMMSMKTGSKGGKTKPKIFTNKNVSAASSSSASQQQPKKSTAGKQQNNTSSPKKQQQNNDVSPKMNARQRVPSGNMNMGLDSFRVPGGGTSKGKQEHNPIPESVKWPLEKYSFQLACQLCFRKEAEGVHGYTYHPEHSHKCPHNLLIVRSKVNSSLNWMKIRPRPNTETHFQSYKLCAHFRWAERCRTGEAGCTFAHNNVEIELWTKDRDKTFNIPNFIRAAQQEGIVSSEILESRLKKYESSQKHHIPKESIHAGIETQPTKTAAMQYQPQLKQIKIPAANNKPTLPEAIPTPASNINLSVKPPLLRLPPSLLPNFSTPPPSIHPMPTRNTAPHTTHTAPHPPSNIPGTSQNKGSAPMPGSYKSGSTQVRHHESPVVKIENPLPRYHYEICCKLCLTPRTEAWVYDYNANLSHLCNQNKLAYCIKDNTGQDSWVLVRERTSHRDFPGNYALCHSVTVMNKDICNHKDSCSFAHNLIEKQLWGMEKSGQFNITEFILQHMGRLSNKGNMSADSVQELIDMYGGYFRYICRKCFFSETCQIISKGDGNCCAGKGKHNWESSSVLAHVNNGSYTVIDGRKFLHHKAYYKLCKFLNYCFEWSNDGCIFAHSKVEMSVWRLERDWNIKRDDVVKESSNIYVKQHYRQQQPEPGVNGVQEVKSAAAEARPGLTPFHRASVDEPPIKIGEYCRTCWGNGTKSQQEGQKDRCVRGHSNYKLNSVFLALPMSKEVRSLPPSLPVGMKFLLCHSGNKCTKKICTFPHSQEELETWTYMSKHGMNKLSDVALKCQEIEKAKTRPINTGESVVTIGTSQTSAWTSQSKPASQIIAPGDLDVNEFYCPYCSISCNNQNQWDSHCASAKHKDNVLWDREHPWNFRQPPWGKTDSLMLCASHMYNKSCRYSTVPDIYNLCTYAHSQDELDEWKERHEFRKMKRSVALQRHMFSYMETLLDDYNKSDKNSNVLSETVPEVSVKCDHGLSVFKKDKYATHMWTFVVTCKKPLMKVSLMLNQDRLHFHLMTPDGIQHQVCEGNAFLVVDDNTGKHSYKVQVTFSGGLFGSFRQWLSLDFGSRPVLIRKLVADVGHQIRQAKVQELRQILDFSRWTSQNKQIVHSDESQADEFDERLLARYKEPVSAEDVVASESLKELNRHNYVHKMHKLIELEEITRHRIVASYNVVTEVSVSSRIEEFGVFIEAQNGQLFLKVPLSDAVTEDTEAGKLLLSRVDAAFISPAQSKSNDVYEAFIVKENNYSYDGLGKDSVYLAVCQSSAASLGLKSGAKIELEIQFQMDRLFFCRMHYALDNLQTTDVVFPDVLKFKPVLGRDVKVSSNVLNDDQMKAVRHIVIDRDIYSPPFIMYGPFGTGKTETLAQATMSLLKDKKPCRVLLCTQSNSASDLYITKHFHQFMKESGGKYKILRILDRRRKKSTVDQLVLPFCFTNDNGEFGLPSKEVILQYQVILVTVESSIQLTNLGLNGAFSHIFVDEAGQTLECEILMPLCLASTKTCVVLTGDHLQISPPVYSLAAQQQNFDVPILVRLFNYYDDMARGPIADAVVEKAQKSPLKIQLSINYRTKTEILRFISTVFYGGPDILKAYGKVPSVLRINPLAFYSVQGKESQVSDCSSYMNPTEAVEVVSQVKLLLEDWPQEWGPKSPQSVAVITNYRDQVKCIRQMLKTSGPKDLRRVFVDTIQGVQGKEFRAVFISTVRTTNLLHESHIRQTLDEGRDIGDLGFLSNPKLLNTALTRAQSFVGVVGDPIALCLIGDCIQEWRTYIKHCSNMRSIHPATHTYDYVRGQVVQLQVGPEGQIVDMLSKQREKNRQQSFPPLSVKPEENVEEDESDQEEEEERVGEAPPFIPTIHDMNNILLPNVKSERENTNHMLNAWEKFFQQPLPNITPSVSSTSSASELTNPSPVKKTTQHSNLNEANLSFNNEVSTEDIIFQLAKENISQSGVSSGNVLIKSECIHITERDGFATLSYRLEKRQGSEIFKITSCEEDFVAFSVHDRDSGITKDYHNLSVEKLKPYIGQLGCYRCRLSVAGEKRVAVILPPSSAEMRQGVDLTGQEVEFAHQFDCGHAFVGDEVLVQLSDKSTPGRLIGQVKGILRSAQDKSNCLLVCQVSDIEPGILKPVDKNFPCMYSLTNETRLPVAEKGNIPVYNFVPSKGIEFTHYEKIKSKYDEQRLFVVRFLTWTPKLSLPVGLVVGSLDSGMSLESGMRILNIEHNLWSPLHPQAEQMTEDVFASDGALSGSMVQGRVNLAGTFCFAITEEDTEDVEMAIHMEEAGDHYRVGIHVSDVTAFIKKDSILDRECEHRSPSLFPGGKEFRHMLPVQACTDTCSLKPDCDRLAFSVLMTVDTTGTQVGDLQVTRSVINVRQQFTLEEVEHILLDSDTESASDFFQSCIVTLYMLTTFWRTQRLGNSSFASSLSPGQQANQHSHLMVDELKHRVNTAVANLLQRSFPHCSPLLVQPAPNADKLDLWRRESAGQAFSCIPMSRAFVNNEVCRCSQMCTCVFNFMRAHQLQPTQNVVIIRDAWLTLCDAGSPEDFDAEKARDLISDVKNLPQLALCDIKFASIQQPEHFACSGVIAESERKHYTMNVSSYTLFTSPLRNFIGIIVQRLLSAYLEGSGSPYTTQEVVELCAEANAHQSQKCRFESQSLRLHLGMALQTRPLSVTAIVQVVDSERMVLSFGEIDGLSQEERTVTLWDLTPASVKVVDQDEDSVRVQWEERIYNYSAPNALGPKQSDLVELDPNQMIYSIPSTRWQQLLIVTRQMVSLDAGEEEFSSFSNHLRDMKRDLGDQFASMANPDPCCQVGADGNTRPHATFSLVLRPSQCVRVQMGTCINQGLMAPSIKLIQLTEQLDLCLEHRTDPQGCFCASQSLEQSAISLSSIEAYQRHWLPMLVSGSAQEAVREGERVTIYGATIAWTSDRDDVVCGDLTLSKAFCARSKFHLPEETSNEGNEQHCLAFMCIRYKNNSLDHLDSSHPDVAALINAKQKVTWVGHCTVTNIQQNTSDVRVRLRLVKSNFAIPDVLLQSGGDKIVCTAEWIGKGQHHSVLDETVRNVHKWSKFAQDVILCRKPVNTIEPVEMPKGMYLEHLSASQQMALGDSYSNPFTLVSGGPGTGKSILASCLAALLVFRNAKVDSLLQQAASLSLSSLGKPPTTQLLVCAPTEHSLDVLTGYIKTLNQNMNLVRVYSEDIEEGDFPTVLNHSGGLRFKPNVQKCQVMKDIALHHLIRMPGISQENNNLLQQEMLISMYGNDPSQVSAVKAATELAQRAQLTKAHVILCTCLTSARKILRECTNIKQVIVDDGTHCSELECLVPVLWHPKVHQMVVLGDRQMPRSPASHSGLGQSLIHRIGDMTKTDLTQQFRCNDSLCQFPAVYFYSGLLSSADATPAPMSPIPSFHWPSQVGFHSLFCHIEVGQEHVGGTAGAGRLHDGFVNKEEAAVMRNLVWSMVVKQQVNPAAILVLTFSPGQTSLIQNAVMQVGLNNVMVRTVQESIGRESQFVLVSTVRSVPPSGISQPPLASWIRKHLGSVSDPYLVNVALTRAQKALFIFGNKDLLSVCEPWRSLLDFYRGKQAVVNRLNL